MARPCPPRGNQVHFGLRLGSFWNGAGKNRRKKGATRYVLNGSVVEQEFPKMRL